MVKDFIALDVETANADFGTICSVGLVHFKDGAVFKSLDILVDPKDTFDPANIRIHGITPERVAGKPSMARVIPVIAAALENAVIVHHSPFDRTALARAAGRYRTGGLPCTWVDSCQAAKRTWDQFRGNGGYGLANLTKSFGIEFKHHRAVDDARASGMLMLLAIEASGIPLHRWVQAPAYAGKKVAQSGLSDGPLAGETVVFTALFRSRDSKLPATPPRPAATSPTA